MSAGSGLPYDKREVVIHPAVDHFPGRIGDGPADLLVDIVHSDIRQCRTTLDDSQRPDQGPGKAFLADFEIFKGALGLCTPLFVRRHLD